MELETEPDRPSTKIAGTILLLCGVVLTTAWTLGRSITREQTEELATMSRTQHIREILGRCRAAEERNSSFYEALTISALDALAYGNSTYGGQWFRVKSFTDGSLVTVSPEEGITSVSRLRSGQSYFSVTGNGHTYGTRLTETSDEPLRSECSKFSREAANMERTLGVSDRRRVLFELIERNFSSPAARRVLVDGALNTLVGDWTDRTYGAGGIRGEWQVMSHWIVFGEWPTQDGSAFASSGIAFPEVPEQRHPAEMDGEIYERVMARKGDLVAVEADLFDLWRGSLHAEPVVNSSPSGFTLPGAQLSIRAGEVLRLSGLILVFLQMLYLISVERFAAEWQDLRSSCATAFPRLSSPSDPLDMVLPRKVASIGARVTWLLFLALPAAIIFWAIITRFSIDPTASYVEWIVLSFPRPNDSDLWLDITNVVCLLVSLLIVMRLTTLKITPYRDFQRALRRRWITAVAAAVFGTTVFLAWQILWENRTWFGGHDARPVFEVWRLLSTLLMICVIIAFNRRAILAGTMSFIMFIAILFIQLRAAGFG